MESWWYFVIAAALVLVVTFGCCVWCHCHERNNEIVVRRRSCVMVFPETSRDTDRIMDYDYQDGVDYAEGSQYDGGTGNPPVPRYGNSHPYGLDIPGGSTYDPQRTLQDNATAISEDGQQYHDGRDDVLGGACSQEKLEGATCSQYYQPTGSHRGSRQGSRGPQGRALTDGDQGVNAGCHMARGTVLPVQDRRVADRHGIGRGNFRFRRGTTR